MTKQFLPTSRWLVTIIMLISFAIGQLAATEEVVHSISFPDENSTSNSCTSYTGTWTATNDETSAKSWSIYGFVNNSWNDSWAKIRAGAKKAKAKDSAKSDVSTITTSASFSEAITKVVVTTVSCYATNDRKLTGTKLVLASNSTFTENVVEYTGPTTATENEMTFIVTTPTASRYYRLEFSWYNNTTSAGVIEISQIDYYHTAASCAVPSAPSNGSFIWTYLFARFSGHCTQYINHLRPRKKPTLCNFSAHFSTTDFQQVTNPSIQASPQISQFVPFSPCFLLFIYIISMIT